MLLLSPHTEPAAAAALLLPDRLLLLGGPQTYTAGQEANSNSKVWLLQRHKRRRTRRQNENAKET